MKQFNTFAANSIALSDYYSPKNSSQGVAFGNSKYQKDSRLKGTSILTQNYFKSNNFNDNLHNPKQQAPIHDHPQPHHHIQNIDQQILEQDENQFETHLSLMMSNVSIPQFNRIDYNQQKLFTLQNNITQHLLQLRQQKIILMQQLSKLMDNKNLFQYYLLKSNLQKQQIQTNNDSPIRYQLDQVGSHQQEQEHAPINLSAPILKENQELHLKLKQLQIKEEIFGSNTNLQQEQNNQKSQELIGQILHIRQLISNVQTQISIKNKKQNQQSRFITFLPQDRQKHFQSNVSRSNVNEEYKELREKLNRLRMLSQSHKYKLTVQEVRYLQDLRRENRRLVEEVEGMISGKRGGVKQSQRSMQLKQLIDENEHQKQIFLSQFQKFKEVMYNAKNENKRLKYQLNI